jgi:hypothetical protein
MGHPFKSKGNWDRLTQPIYLQRYRRMSIQSECIPMISCYRHPSSWQRRSSFCVSCSHPHQTIGPLLLAPAPTIHPKMDEASSYLTTARNLNGCCSREVRTGRRECYGGYLAYRFVKWMVLPLLASFSELWLSQMKGCKSISCICIVDAIRYSAGDGKQISFFKHVNNM